MLNCSNLETKPRYWRSRHRHQSSWTSKNHFHLRSSSHHRCHNNRSNWLPCIKLFNLIRRARQKMVIMLVAPQVKLYRQIRPSNRTWCWPIWRAAETIILISVGWLSSTLVKHNSIRETKPFLHQQWVKVQLPCPKHRKDKMWSQGSAQPTPNQRLLRKEQQYRNQICKAILHSRWRVLLSLGSHSW